MSTVGSSTHDETMSQRSEGSYIPYHHIPRLEEEEDNGEVRISVKYLKKLFRDNFKLYYGTFELNEKLYLHYKGFKKIENLHLFPDLKCVYLEGNGFTKIEGFENNLKMKCLYIQENIFDKIENINHMKELHYLNLNDNYISTIENLADMPNLGTLQIKKNRIGRNGISDVIGLLEIPTISVLDISDNLIDDPEVIDQVFVKMPNLAVLYLKGNPVVKKIKNYKKSLIAKMPNLKFLDDSPVFLEDRRYAEAFAAGGIDAEREERKKVKKEKEDEHWRNHDAFREMIRKAKEDKRLRDEEEQKKKDEQPHAENIEQKHEIQTSEPPASKVEPVSDKPAEVYKNELKEMIERSRQKLEEKKSQVDAEEEEPEDVPELEELTPEEIAKEMEKAKVKNIIQQFEKGKEVEDSKSEINSIVDVEDVKVEQSNSVNMSVTSETEENANNVSSEHNEITDEDKKSESEEEKHLEDSTSEVDEESNKTEPNKQQDTFDYDTIDKNFSITKLKAEDGEYLEELD